MGREGNIFFGMVHTEIYFLIFERVIRQLKSPTIIVRRGTEEDDFQPI